jgi:hypothetical protein
MAIDTRVQEIIDVLVLMIERGESLANVADRGMLLARRFEGKGQSAEIPQPVSNECPYDEDSAFLAWTYNDDYATGVRLTDLAIDQIRERDTLYGIKTAVTPEEWFDLIVRRIQDLSQAQPLRLQETTDGFGHPDLVVADDVAQYLCHVMVGLPSYKHYELWVVSKSLNVPEDLRERALNWLVADYPEQRGPADYTKAAAAAVLLAVHKQLLDDGQ